MDQGTVAYILAQTQHHTISRKLPGTHCPAMSCDVLIAMGITNVLLLLDRHEPMGHDVMDRPFACLRTAGGPVRHGEPH
jgi:hypothetical protein